MTAAFDAWHARAMALMEELSDAAKDYGRDSEELRHLNSYGAVDGSPLDAARAALAAHLAELPMGRPVVHCSLTHSGTVEHFDGRPMVMIGPVGNDMHRVPLYRHPKDTA